jgi:hypothetical protein
MMNLLCTQQGSRIRLIVFPRGKHRPDVYYASGEQNVTVSPASVDLAGLMITPLKKDFDKLSSDILRQIFREVFPDDAAWKKILDTLRKNLS